MYALNILRKAGLHQVKIRKEQENQSYTATSRRNSCRSNRPENKKKLRLGPEVIKSPCVRARCPTHNITIAQGEMS
jgi:hypothetical protein